jgi:hypothetical protein
MADRRANSSAWWAVDRRVVLVTRVPVSTRSEPFISRSVTLRATCRRRSTFDPAESDPSGPIWDRPRRWPRYRPQRPAEAQADVAGAPASGSGSKICRYTSSP